MANEGVMRLETAREAVSAPEVIITLAPEVTNPIEKCVSVLVPPVHCGKVVAAALDTCVGAVPETVKPPLERAMATRA